VPTQHRHRIQYSILASVDIGGAHRKRSARRSSSSSLATAIASAFLFMPGVIRALQRTQSRRIRGNGAVASRLRSEGIWAITRALVWFGTLGRTILPVEKGSNAIARAIAVRCGLCCLGYSMTIGGVLLTFGGKPLILRLLYILQRLKSPHCFFSL